MRSADVVQNVASAEDLVTVSEPLANTPALWSAAGSGAPRRFGFFGGGWHEVGLSPSVGSRSKAPSPLRSAGALQKPAHLPMALVNARRFGLRQTSRP